MKKNLELIGIFVASILVLEFLIFPGLTINNTIVNILSGVIGVLLGIIVLTYSDGIIREKFEKKPTELSEEKPLNPESKKKKNSKQSVKEGYDENAPFVKTKKKKNKTKKDGEL